MMKKAKWMRPQVVVVFIIIIVMVVAGSMELKEARDKMKGQFDQQEEMDVLEQEWQINNLGILIVNLMVDNFYKNGKYEIDRDMNLLDKVSNRQKWIMENIVSLNGYNDWVGFSHDGQKINNGNLNDDKILWYYPYDKFNVEYEKIFGDNFDRKKAKTSGNGNELDKDDNYVYYEKGKLTGEAGEIVIDKISYDDDKDLMVAIMTINYNSQFSDKLGYDSDDVVFSYRRDKKGRKAETLIVK